MDATDDEENTPLHVAIEAGKLKIVENLLDYGADLGKMNDQEKTALNLAIEEGQCEIVKLLLSHGAKIDKNDQPALHQACDSGHRDLVELFLERGDDIYQLGYSDATLLHSAVHGANPDIVKMFLDKFDLEARDNIGKTPLFYTNGEKVIELLIDRGADIHAISTGEYGMTVLQRACHRDYSAAAKVLLEHGADFNSKNSRGECLMEIGFEKTFSSKVKSVIKVIVRHLVKMKSEDVFVSEDNLRVIEGDERLKSFQDRCESEIEEMKKEVLEGSTISFYHFLTLKNLNQLAAVAGNEDVLKVLKSDVCKTKFPLYADLLKYQMRKGLWRKLLLGKVRRFFHAVADAEGNEGLAKLPITCIDKIFSYLRNIDLKTLIEVCDPVNKFTTEFYDIAL